MGSKRVTAEYKYNDLQDISQNTTNNVLASCALLSHKNLQTNKSANTHTHAHAHAHTHTHTHTHTRTQTHTHTHIYI